MKNTVAKISLFILIGIVHSACDSLKRVPERKLLLTKNEILVDGKKSDDEEITELVYQKPNSRILGFPFRLNIYNLATPNPDSVYKAKFINNPAKLKRQIGLLSEKQVKRKGESFFYSGIHNFLKKTGEAPVIVDKARAQKSLTRLRSYYFNNGYFNNTTSFSIDTIAKKKAKINYIIQRGTVSVIDSIGTKITTPALDSLYQLNKTLSLIKQGDFFKSKNFDAERNRITTHFRNNGAYDFQQSYINYDVDTVATGNKSNVKVVIGDYSTRQGDSTVTRPFKLYNISKVNIFTDTPVEKKDAIVKDTTIYKNFNLYSYDKLRYKPKALTDAIFITPGTKYSDLRTNLTTRYLNNLKIFSYPSIQYIEDKDDPSGSSLIANVILTPRKKKTFGAALDVTHSNIQDFGISLNTSLVIRNIFRGAETFNISARGNIGSSRDLANPNNQFFNISEYGIDTKLSFPRILMPFNTEKIIPKNMIPSTVVSLGFAKQQNIGLDKENFTGSMVYNWNPRRKNSARVSVIRFDLFNIQYVNNINTANYFNVYNSSYRILNDFAKTYNVNPANVDANGNLTILEGGANNFITDVLNSNTSITPEDNIFKRIRSVEERRKRLTENNLILASSYSFSRTTKDNLADNTFYVFRAKVESAGNVLSLFAAASTAIDDANNKKKIFDIEFSQYVKTELEYIRHWDLSKDKVFAVRSFFGIAIPYGNSTNIPFSRSYFAGGSNDIRAWQPYSLGPGSSGGINDFNEANMKITMSGEFRFRIFNNLKGALFVDAGNIWNVLDDVEDKPSVFEGFKSLKNIAVGSGFGFRYDLNFFVVRLDLGFKTYNPSDEPAKRWFRDYNFGNSVLNIGINYPF